MFKKLFLPLLASFSFCIGLAEAQTCATPFTATGTTLVEVCDTTGPDTYAIDVTATSDSTLSFVGLYRELTPIMADIDCNAGTFYIPPQHLFTNYYITGVGSLALPNVNFSYEIRREADSTLADGCTGYYAGSAVGTQAPLYPNLFIYPNPAASATNIRLDGISHGSEWDYRLQDLQGRSLMYGKLESGQGTLDLRNLAKGVYLVQVRSEESEVMSRRLVVR